MLEKLNNEKLAHNFFFLLSLLVLPFIGWALDNFSLVFIGVGVSVVLKLFLTCDIRLLFLDFMIPFVTTRENLRIETFPRALIPLALLIVLASILIPMKNVLLNGKPKKNGGALTRSFLIIGVIMMLSPLVRNIFYNVPAFPDYPGGYQIIYGYLFGLGFLLLPLLLYAISTYKTNDPSPIPNLMYQLGVFLLAEIAYVMFYEGLSLHDTLWYGGIGWGCKNLFMICFELTIPFTAYKFSQNWKRIDCLFVFLASLVLGLSSNSRSAQITIIVALPFLFYLLTPRVKHFKTILVISFVVLIAAGVCSLLFIPQLQNSIKRLIDSIVNGTSFGDIFTDRDVFWKWIAEYVFGQPKHLLFGGSFVFCFEMYQKFWEATDMNIWLAHNVFMTLLACGGLLGLLAIIYHFIDVCFVINKNKQISRLLYYTFLLMGFVHGLGDNTIFNIVFMVPYIFVLQDLNRFKKVE